MCLSQIKLNVDYIPPSQSDKYSKEAVGKDLLALVPPGKTPQQFQQNIAAKFKNVIVRCQCHCFAVAISRLSQRVTWHALFIAYSVNVCCCNRIVFF